VVGHFPQQNLRRHVIHLLRDSIGPSPWSALSLSLSLLDSPFYRSPSGADAERLRIFGFFRKRTRARADSNRCDCRDTRRGTKRTKTQRCTGPHVPACSVASAAARHRSAGRGYAYWSQPHLLAGINCPPPTVLPREGTRERRRYVRTCTCSCLRLCASLLRSRCVAVAVNPPR